MPFEPFHVEGLGELNRALREFGTGVRTELRKELAEAAEPVARTAERLAYSEISGMRRRKTVDWSKMRIGVAGGNAPFVYIAPRQRGRKRGRARRPNLVNLMLNRSMVPAARKQAPTVERAAGRAVTRAMRRAGF